MHNPEYDFRGTITPIVSHCLPACRERFASLRHCVALNLCLCPLCMFVLITMHAHCHVFEAILTLARVRVDDLQGDGERWRCMDCLLVNTACVSAPAFG